MACAGVRAKVLSVDLEAQRVSLGLKPSYFAGEDDKEEVEGEGAGAAEGRQQSGDDEDDIDAMAAAGELSEDEDEEQEGALLERGWGMDVAGSQRMECPFCRRLLCRRHASQFNLPLPLQVLRKRQEGLRRKTTMGQPPWSMMRGTQKRRTTTMRRQAAVEWRKGQVMRGPPRMPGARGLLLRQASQGGLLVRSTASCCKRPLRKQSPEHNAVVSQLSKGWRYHLPSCAETLRQTCTFPDQAQSWGWRRASAGLMRSLRQLQMPAMVRAAFS